MINIKNISLDPSNNPSDLTRVDSGYLPSNLLLNIPGACNEHLLFRESPYGRKTESDFNALANDIALNGMQYPVTVHVEKGVAVIWEGNHRLRAVASKGLPVFVEIKYFGADYKTPLFH